MAEAAGVECEVLPRWYDDKLWQGWEGVQRIAVESCVCACTQLCACEWLTGAAGCCHSLQLDEDSTLMRILDGLCTAWMPVWQVVQKQAGAVRTLIAPLLRHDEDA